MYVFMSKVKQTCFFFFVLFFKSIGFLSSGDFSYFFGRPHATQIEETLLPSFYSFVLWLKLVLHLLPWFHFTSCNIKKKKKKKSDTPGDLELMS